MQMFRFVFALADERETMLNHLGIQILHRAIAKKRNEMLPDVRAVIDGRGFPVLTQHFCFPTLGEVSELRCWHWSIVDTVDVGDPIVELTLRELFCWIVLFRADCRLAPNSSDLTFVNNIFSPPSIPGLFFKPQLDGAACSSRRSVRQ